MQVLMEVVVIFPKTPTYESYDDQALLVDGLIYHKHQPIDKLIS